MNLAEVRDAFSDPAEVIAALITAGVSLTITAAATRHQPPLEFLAAMRQGAQHMQAGEFG